MSVICWVNSLRRRSTRFSCEPWGKPRTRLRQTARLWPTRCLHGLKIHTVPGELGKLQGCSPCLVLAHWAARYQVVWWSPPQFGTIQGCSPCLVVAHWTAHYQVVWWNPPLSGTPVSGADFIHSFHFISGECSWLSVWCFIFVVLWPIWITWTHCQRKAVKFNHSLTTPYSPHRHPTPPLVIFVLHTLTHWGLVTPYGDRDLGQHWLRRWLVAWRHQAITWTNVDLSSVRSCGHHVRAISLEMPQSSVTKIYLKITCLKFHSNFPGANALKYDTTWCSHKTWESLSCQLMSCLLELSPQQLWQCCG